MRKLMALTVPLLLAAGILAAFGDRPGILARFARFRVSAVEVRAPATSTPRKSAVGFQPIRTNAGGRVHSRDASAPTS